MSGDINIVIIIELSNSLAFFITLFEYLRNLNTLLVFKYGFIDKNNSLIVDTIHTIKLAKLQAIKWGFTDANEVVKNYNAKTNFLTNIYDSRIKLQAGLFVVQFSKMISLWRIQI